MDWYDFAIRVGLPSAALAGIGWFVAARVWPFVINAWQEQQRERLEERDRFLSALEKNQETFQKLVDTERVVRLDERDKFLSALEKHREELQGITRTQQQLRRALERKEDKKQDGH